MRESDDEEGDGEGGREEGACCAGAGMEVVHLFSLPVAALRDLTVRW